MSSPLELLYVDADPAAEAVRESLEAAGFSVETVASADEGVARLGAADAPDFDCVVSALELPDADGLEFLRSVRSDHPSVPFVLYPDAGSEMVASEAVSAGVTEYVPRADRTGHERLLEAIRDSVEHSSTGSRPEADDAGGENASEPSVADAPEDAVEHSSTSPPSHAQEDAVEHSSTSSRPEADDAVEHGSTSLPSQAREDAGSENASEPSVAVAEDAVKTADRERFGSLFEHLPTPVCYGKIRPDGPVVERVNPAFEEAFGYGTEEMIGENLDELIVPEGRRDGAVEINERLLAGERIHAEVRRLTPEGVRDFQLDVLGPEDTLEGYAIYTDVTESKRRQRELERQNERLESFVSVVSHDLRSPLAVAKGNVELAREERDGKLLKNANEALDRMAALIDDLLTLARKGERVSDLEAVALRPVAESCWNSVETAEATLRVETDRTIRADRSRVRQLLSNLYRNAVEHSSTSSRPKADDAESEDASEPSVADASEDAAEHSSTSSRPEADDAGSENASEPSVADAPEDAVEHSSTSPPSQAREDAGERGGENVTVTVGNLADGFYVADDGPGLPESDRDRIFESGFTTDDEGTGFGLSIVSEIAEAHGWTVAAADGADGGARFEITGVEVVEGENGGDDGG